MRVVIIGKTPYQLPDDDATVSRILSHLDMVKNGKKQFAKMFTFDGDTHQLPTTFLRGAKLTYIEDPTFYHVEGVSDKYLNHLTKESLITAISNELVIIDGDDESVRRDFKKQLHLDLEGTLKLYNLTLTTTTEPIKK